MSWVSCPNPNPIPNPTSHLVENELQLVFPPHQPLQHLHWRVRAGGGPAGGAGWRGRGHGGQGADVFGIRLCCRGWPRRRTSLLGLGLGLSLELGLEYRSSLQSLQGGTRVSRVEKEQHDVCCAGKPLDHLGGLSSGVQVALGLRFGSLALDQYT